MNKKFKTRVRIPPGELFIFFCFFAGFFVVFAFCQLKEGRAFAGEDTTTSGSGLATTGDARKSTGGLQGPAQQQKDSKKMFVFAKAMYEEEEKSAFEPMKKPAVPAVALPSSTRI